MLMVCKTTFFTRGHKVKGGSILDEEHPLVVKFPEHFVPIEETRIAEATATPPRPARQRQAPVEGDEGDKGNAVNEELTRPNNGASKKDWAAFAEANGVDVPEGAKRDDIIKLVDEHAQVAH